MKLEFETWVEQQGFSVDARDLFEESIKCFRVSAYRGAYLLSYVGFLVVIKERLLKSEKPHGIGNEQWENDILKKIRNDDKWEEETYNILNKRGVDSKSKYFLVNSHLLNDLEYFKRRRNDCAHAKDTKIDYSHVEVLWNFLQSHLSKFVVNGGEEGLIEKIKKHYNPLYTQPNTSPSHLIEDIPLIIETTNIPNFLEKIDDNHIAIENAYFGGEEPLNFWGELIRNKNKDIHDGFVSYLKNNKEEKLPVFLYYFPEQLQYFTDEPSIIRWLWKRGLFYRMHAFTNQYWDLPIALLRNNHIPDEEKPGFINRLVQMIDYDNFPNEEQTNSFKEHNFLNSYRDYVINDLFKRGRASYIDLNKNSNKIMYYIKNAALDEEIVIYLNDFFQGFKFGAFKDALDEYIKETPEFLEDFHEILQRKEIDAEIFFNR